MRCLVFGQGALISPVETAISRALGYSVETGAVDGWDPDSVAVFPNGREALEKELPGSDCCIVDTSEDPPVVRHLAAGEEIPGVCNEKAIVCEVF